MTRVGGQRDRGIRWVLPLALLCSLLLSSTYAQSEGIVFGGRAGLEVDGIGQEYRSFGILDERAGESIEQQIEDIPVRTKDARTLALLELHLRGGRQTGAVFEMVNTGRLGAGRARNSFRIESGLRWGANRFRLENQWDIQDGDDEPTPSNQDRLNLTWDRDDLPLGFQTQLRIGATWSDSPDSSLATLFHYRNVRAHLQLRRTLTPTFELRGRFGMRQKEAFDFSGGSYEAPYGELEAAGSVRSRDQLSAIVRFDDRNYTDGGDSTKIPSSENLQVETRYAANLGESWRPFVEQLFQRQDYRTAPQNLSSVFVDAYSWRGRLGTDYTWKPGTEDSDNLDRWLRAGYRFRFGAELEFYRSEEPVDGTESFSAAYDSYGMILGVGREGGEKLWLDLSMSIGRRDYRTGQGLAPLDIGGFDFSLSRSDYTFVRTTFLADWKPVPWLRGEIFLQWDEEMHEADSDDFRLWILNTSLTYPF